MLFDLDDTLFDHQYSDHLCLEVIWQTYLTPAITPLDEFITQAEIVFDEFWGDVLRGTLTIKAWHRKAIQQLFDDYDINHTTDVIDVAAQRYRQTYQQSRRSIDGAVDLLTVLKEKATIGIVSNHLTHEQSGKLDACHLNGLYDFMVCADEVDKPKPDPAMFELALQRSGTQVDQAVMIGDSWSSDIVGATAIGMRAIWFNPENKPHPTELPVKTIQSWQPVQDAIALILNE